MTKIKNLFTIQNLYILLCAAMTGIFVFEVPKAVFYSPVVLFALFVAWGYIKKRKIKVNVQAGLLTVFIFSFVICSFHSNQSIYYQSYIHIHAVFMYLIGLNFFNDKPPEERRSHIENYFLVISLMYLVYVGLTFYHYFYQTKADLEVRFYYSIWYHSVVKPATVISMSLVFPLVYGIYALFYLKLPKKIIGLVFIAITLFINIKTGTRTLVFLFPFLVSAELIFMLIFKKKKVKLGIGLTVCLVVFLAVIVFLFIKYEDVFAERFDGFSFQRFFGTDGSVRKRNLYNMNVIKDFSLTYFGGGEHSATVGTPHNIWLYIYDWGGIVSFLIYMAFTVIIVVDFVKFFLNKYLSVELKALVTTALSVIFVEFMMEPFILPLPSFYILCLFVLGLISGFSKYPKVKII